MSQPPEIIRASHIERWSDTADVIVVGMGIAGAFFTWAAAPPCSRPPATRIRPRPCTTS